MIGIDIPTIDGVFAEVSAEVAADRERFVLMETNRMAFGAQAAKEALYRRVLDLSQGNVLSADRAMVGLCFAHRLLQRSQPNNGAGLLDDTVAMSLRLGGTTEDLGTKYLPDADKNVQYYLELEARFANNPAVFEHLLSKFTNQDSNTGAQVLLLCASSLLVAEAVEAPA